MRRQKARQAAAESAEVKLVRRGHTSRRFSVWDVDLSPVHTPTLGILAAAAVRARRERVRMEARASRRISPAFRSCTAQAVEAAEV